MAYYKFLLAVIAILAASCNGAAVRPRISDEHNIDNCDMSTALTTSLLQTNIYEAGQFLKILKRTIPFTESPTQPNPIKCIKVINLDTSTRGGYPTLVQGGVGAYNAEILLTSQRGQALNFRIEIWA